MEVGLVFNSKDEVKEKVKEYADTRNFKSRNRGIDKASKRWIFVCNKGFVYKSQATVRLNQKSIKTNCPFKIRFRMEDQDSWRIVQLQENHNHPLENKVPSSDTLLAAFLEAMRKVLIRFNNSSDHEKVLIINQLNHIAKYDPDKTISNPSTLPFKKNPPNTTSTGSDPCASEKEDPRQRRCGRCREFGHNARTCITPVLD